MQDHLDNLLGQIEGLESEDLLLNDNELMNEAAFMVQHRAALD